MVHFYLTCITFLPHSNKIECRNKKVSEKKRQNYFRIRLNILLLFCWVLLAALVAHSEGDRPNSPFLKIRPEKPTDIRIKLTSKSLSKIRQIEHHCINNSRNPRNSIKIFINQWRIPQTWLAVIKRANLMATLTLTPGLVKMGVLGLLGCGLAVSFYFLMEKKCSKLNEDDDDDMCRIKDSLHDDKRAYGVLAASVFLAMSGFHRLRCQVVGLMERAKTKDKCHMKRLRNSIALLIMSALGMMAFGAVYFRGADTQPTIYHQEQIPDIKPEEPSVPPPPSMSKDKTFGYNWATFTIATVSGLYFLFNFEHAMEHHGETFYTNKDDFPKYKPRKSRRGSRKCSKTLRSVFTY